jgi:hypothetical protein
MTTYSCAKRAADPSNLTAACRQWCGNTETCLHTGDDESLIKTMMRYYRDATPETQAYLRGEGPKSDTA